MGEKYRNLKRNSLQVLKIELVHRDWRQFTMQLFKFECNFDQKSHF